jgi:hypothetical protein
MGYKNKKIYNIESIVLNVMINSKNYIYLVKYEELQYKIQCSLRFMTPPNLPL